MLKELAKSKKKYKPLLETMEVNPDKILSTILVAKNIADVTTAMLSGYIIDVLSQQWLLSENISFFLSILFATVTILIFGEIIPKSIGKLYGERLLASNLWIINSLYYCLYPLSYITKFARFFVRRIDKFHPEENHASSSEQEIQFLIEQVKEKGLIDSEKVNMLLNVFRLGNKSVCEIMITKNEVMALSAQISLKDAFCAFSECQLSRMPVYDVEFNNMIGILHQKDLFTRLLQGKECSIVDIVRPLLFIPTQMHLNELLKEFKEQRTHIAMVINEFGNIDGLITLEDILEEIVGEIHDEYKEKIPKIIQIKPGGWLVDASIKLSKIEPLLSINFEVSQASTLGGFVTELLHRLPREGEYVLYKNHVFHIKKANTKQILQVLVTFEHVIGNLQNSLKTDDAEKFID